VTGLQARRPLNWGSISAPGPAVGLTLLCVCVCVCVCDGLYVLEDKSAGS
jgi:hypothetical protein